MCAWTGTVFGCFLGGLVSLFFKKESTICPARERLDFYCEKNNQSRTEFFLSVCAVKEAVFSHGNMKYSFQGQIPRSCLDTASMDVWQAFQEVQPHRWVDLCCEGNTDHPQTRGNAAALVMPQLLMSDHKSHEDHCYIWQPGWREWQDCTDCTPWISSSLQPNKGIAWSNSPEQSQRQASFGPKLHHDQVLPF